MLRPILITLALGLVGGFVAYGKYHGVRNDLVTQREAIDAAWAQVDAALQERADLIPELLDAGRDGRETPVLDGLTAARMALIQARTPQQKIEANTRLDQAIGGLLSVVERQPRLRSSENLLRLRDELAGAENRIAVERRKYNETVQRYNTQIELFPDNIVASLAGFTRNDAYFKTEPGGRTAPDLRF